MRLALLGNVTPDLLARDFTRAGEEVYLSPGFDAWRQDVLDPTGGLRAFDPDAVLFLAEGGAAEADRALLRTHLPRARLIAPDLARLADETPGFWDERLRALAAMPFSLAGLRAVEEEFRFLVDGAPKKILAVDADNTLWRGIVSEDGAEAVAPFADFQRGLLALRARGVLLVLLSKNDPPAGGATPLERALARDDMPLAWDDFAATGVAWSPKAGNLLALCEQLNLGVESVVFVDDNPVERAQMKAHLPAVAVPPFPADGLAQPAQFLRRLDAAYFADVGATDEDRARAARYRDEAARRVVAAAAPSLDAYLDGLRLTCRAARATAADIPRLAQMAGKTNQFNVTTLRRTADDFAALLADPQVRVWTFRAGDAFGDMGLVCYVVYDARTARLTDFVMSCRAMGRTIEHFALNHVRAALAAEGLPLAGVDVTPTAKNGPARAFFAGVDLARPCATHVAAAPLVISVVTVCFNSAATLPATLASVLAQRDVALDYHVVDGGSRDGTVDLLRAWEPKFREKGVRFTWTSEPDAGIYDAMNKGLSRAAGDVLGILNADDRFEDASVLADVARAFTAPENAALELLYGDVRFVRGDNPKTVRYYSSRPWRPWMHNWGYMPAHPSVYVRRETFAASGGYRTDYRISADFEWMTRVLCRRRVRARYVPRCFVAMRLGGASTGGLRAMLRLNRENVRANRENGFFCCLAMMLPKYAYKALGYLVRK